MLRRHKPRCRGHILRCEPGETLNDINRLADDPALLRVLGSRFRMTTVGDFLARFRHEKDEAKAQEPRRLPGDRGSGFLVALCRGATVATLDWDSSNHVVYGEQKEGADFAHDKKWCYNVLYATGRDRRRALSTGRVTSGSTAGDDPGQQVLSQRAHARRLFYDQEIARSARSARWSSSS